MSLLVAIPCDSASQKENVVAFLGSSLTDTEQTWSVGGETDYWVPKMENPLALRMVFKRH